jgi:hypothetical protein
VGHLEAVLSRWTGCSGGPWTSSFAARIHPAPLSEIFGPIATFDAQPEDHRMSLPQIGPVAAQY